MYKSIRGPSAAPRRRVVNAAALLVAAPLLAALLHPGVAVGARGDREERLKAREAARRGDYDTPSRYWREGPARYLLSKDEDRAFRKLGSEEERAQFIQRFWARRDPAPSTPDNEYRTLFYRRVQQATQMFTESTKPGWKTDRGKIFILLGPPDEMDQPGRRSLARNVDLWTYRDAPAGSAVGANSIVRFVKDFSGEYRLSTRLRLFGGETTLGLGLQVQAMQVKSLPGQDRLLDAIVNTEPSPGSGPFRTQRDFFASGDGRTLAVLTLGVQEDLLLRGDVPESGPGVPPAPEPVIPPEGGRYQVIARLVGASGAPVYDLAGENALCPAPADLAGDRGGFMLFQGASFVNPGRYTAYYGLVDRATGRIHSYRDAIDVPRLRDDTLSVGSINLASRIERLPGFSASRYSAPFVLGNLRVLPRADEVFRSGENFAFYFQVNGAARDPIDGRPDLDLVYRFFVARGPGPDGKPLFLPFGNPIRLTRQQGIMQGYSMILEDWAPTTYRLRVEVIDNLRGKRATRQVTFRVS